MKQRLLELLVCPHCGGPFELEVFAASVAGDGSQEVEQGVLRSGCGVWYPIVDAIPVVLPNALSIYPEFAAAFQGRLPEWKIPPEEIARFEEEKRRTQESFGFEWTIYAAVRQERDLGYVLEGGLAPDFFSGKLVLDAGCGYGRHAIVVQGFGAEVVGVDLSVAVVNARRLTRDLPRVHIVQSDLFALPFRAGTFDLVYSWGVLHHTPDPRRAFAGLVDLVKDGGDISVKIYRRRPVPAAALESAIRKVTVKLPLKTLYRLAYGAVPLNWFYWVLGRHVPGLRDAIQGVIRVDPNWRISHIDTFDWYHPQYQFHFPMEEVESWFGEEGLADIVGVESMGVRGRKPEAPGERAK